VRALAIGLLLGVVAAQVSCTYSFAAGSIPRLEPPTPATRPAGIASYSLRVRDTTFDHQPQLDAAFEDALVRVLDETGLFSRILRNDSDSIQLADGDLHLDAEVTIEQSSNALPHRIASLLTVALIPMWGHVRQTLRGSVRTADREAGPYVIEDEQTLVIWLPLAVVSIPDFYYGALTGNGNSMERLDRNLFRNLLAAARRDGLVAGPGPPARFARRRGGAP
jgi:hypothetical protein